MSSTDRTPYQKKSYRLYTSDTVPSPADPMSDDTGQASVPDGSPGQHPGQPRYHYTHQQAPITVRNSRTGDDLLHSPPPHAGLETALMQYAGPPPPQPTDKH